MNGLVRLRFLGPAQVERGDQAAERLVPGNPALRGGGRMTAGSGAQGREKGTRGGSSGGPIIRYAAVLRAFWAANLAEELQYRANFFASLASTLFCPGLS